MNEWCRDVILNEARRNLPLSPALISPVSPSTTASLAPVSPEPPVPASLGQLVRQVSLQMPPLKETETRKYAFPEILPDLEMRIDLYQPGAHKNSFRSLVSLAILQVSSYTGSLAHTHTWRCLHIRMTQTHKSAHIRTPTCIFIRSLTE